MKYNKNNFLNKIKAVSLEYLSVNIECLLLLNDKERILNYIKDFFDLNYTNIVEGEEFTDKNYIFKELNMLKEFEKEISLNEKLYSYLGNSFYNKKIYNISSFFYNLGALINPKEFLYKSALTTYYQENYIYNKYNLFSKILMNKKRKDALKLLKTAEKIAENKKNIYLLFCSIYLNMNNTRLYNKYIDKLKKENNFNLLHPEFFNLNLSIMRKNNALLTDFERLLSKDEEQNNLIYINILQIALSNNDKKYIDIYYPKYLNNVLKDENDNLHLLFLITAYIQEKYCLADIFLEKIKKAFAGRFKKLYTEYNLCLKNNLKEILPLYEEYIIKWVFYFTQILKNSSNNSLLEKIKQDEYLIKILCIIYQTFCNNSKFVR